MFTYCLLFVQVLDHWFESEPLKATLATDGVIGAMLSPHSPGSGCVFKPIVFNGVVGYIADIIDVFFF